MLQCRRSRGTMSYWPRSWLTAVALRARGKKPNIKPLLEPGVNAELSISASQIDLNIPIIVQQHSAKHSPSGCALSVTLSSKHCWSFTVAKVSQHKTTFTKVMNFLEKSHISMVCTGRNSNALTTGVVKITVTRRGRQPRFPLWDACVTRRNADFRHATQRSVLQATMN